MNDYQHSPAGAALLGRGQENAYSNQAIAASPKITRLENLRDRLEKIHAQLQAQNQRRAGIIDKLLGGEPETAAGPKEGAQPPQSMTHTLDFLAERIFGQLQLADYQLERLNSL